MQQQHNVVGGSTFAALLIAAAVCFSGVPVAEAQVIGLGSCPSSVSAVSNLLVPLVTSSHKTFQLAPLEN